MEVAERANTGDYVARFEAEEIAGSDARCAVLAGWRCSDTDIKSERRFGLLIVGERIVVAKYGSRVASYEIKDVLIPPHCREWFGNIEIAEADRLVGRNVELQIVSRREGYLLAPFLGSKNEFFDEGGDIAIADDAERVGFLGACPSAARPARWDPSVNSGLAVAEHLDDHQWSAVHRLLRHSADGRRDNWGGPTRPDWQTEPLDGSQLNSTTRRLFWARRRQRNVLFDSHRDTGRNRT